MPHPEVTFLPGEMLAFRRSVVGHDNFPVRAAKISSQGFIDCSVPKNTAFTVMSSLTDDQARDAASSMNDRGMVQSWLTTDRESWYLLMSQEGIVALCGYLLTRV